EEVRLAEVRPAEVRFAEVLTVEVRSPEVRTDVGVLVTPLVPSGHALLEDLRDVLVVRHRSIPLRARRMRVRAQDLSLSLTARQPAIRWVEAATSCGVGSRFLANAPPRGFARPPGGSDFFKTRPSLRPQGRSQNSKVLQGVTKPKNAQKQGLFWGIRA